MRPWLHALIGNQSGATAVEYGLIIALVVLTMLMALNGMASAIIGLWKIVADKVAAVA